MRPEIRGRQNVTASHVSVAPIASASVCPWMLMTSSRFRDPRSQLHFPRGEQKSWKVFRPLQSPRRATKQQAYPLSESLDVFLCADNADRLQVTPFVDVRWSLWPRDSIGLPSTRPISASTSGANVSVVVAHDLPVKNGIRFVYLRPQQRFSLHINPDAYYI